MSHFRLTAPSPPSVKASFTAKRNNSMCFMCCLIASISSVVSKAGLLNATTTDWPNSPGCRDVFPGSQAPFQTYHIRFPDISPVPPYPVTLRSNFTITGLRLGRRPLFTTFPDVEELLRTQISTEACLGDHIITIAHRHLGGEHGVATSGQMLAKDRHARSAVFSVVCTRLD